MRERDKGTQHACRNVMTVTDTISINIVINQSAIDVASLMLRIHISTLPLILNIDALQYFKQDMTLRRLYI